MYNKKLERGFLLYIALIVIPNDITNSFRSGSYTETILQEDTIFYRVSGGNAREVGHYFSRTPQAGGLQSQLDLALNPEWGNTASIVSQVNVPAGTAIYEGFAAQQNITGGILSGGGSQIYIPEVDATWWIK